MTEQARSFQREQARAKANYVRLSRAELHREIHALPEAEGRALLGAYLTDPPDFLLTARISHVLTWPLHMGPARANRMMRATTIGDRTIGQASPRQRANLARCLRGLEDLVMAEEQDRIVRVGEERAA